MAAMGLLSSQSKNGIAGFYSPIQWEQEQKGEAESEAEAAEAETETETLSSAMKRIPQPRLPFRLLFCSITRKKSIQKCFTMLF